ncbi:HdeD family acid-resistance protein [Streptomyces sp. NPDC056653]|uniref:HdeD family acid-resistance protein n=1 Tax=Streptomyces sp. NPDC056653 TaxID=3345894 RepID=UPI003693E3D2
MANATASDEVGHRTMHPRFVSGTKRHPHMWKVTMLSSPNALLWRGLLAVVIGIVSVTWPGITVGALVILFAVYAFMSAVTDGARAFASDRVGPVFGWLLLALLSLAAGVVALSWPGITALVLTIWVAAWALATGVMEIVLAFQRGEKAGGRALFLLTGLVSIALAFVLFVRPDIGAVSLATVFGLFSIVYGVSAVFASFEERRGRTNASRSEPVSA